MPGALRFWTLASNIGKPLTLWTKMQFLNVMRADADRFEIQCGPVASEVVLSHAFDEADEHGLSGFSAYRAVVLSPASLPASLPDVQ